MRSLICSLDNIPKGLRGLFMSTLPCRNCVRNMSIKSLSPPKSPWLKNPKKSRSLNSALTLLMSFLKKPTINYPLIEHLTMPLTSKTLSFQKSPRSIPSTQLKKKLAKPSLKNILKQVASSLPNLLKLSHSSLSQRRMEPYVPVKITNTSIVTPSKMPTPSLSSPNLLII